MLGLLGFVLGFVFARLMGDCEPEPVEETVSTEWISGPYRVPVEYYEGNVAMRAARQ